MDIAGEIGHVRGHQHGHRQLVVSGLHSAFSLIRTGGDTIDANEDGSGHKFSIVMIEIAPGRADIRGLF